MLTELPSELTSLCRGSMVGEVERFDPQEGLSGWACCWPPDPAAPPLRLRLVLEDLLAPASAPLLLAELEAHLPRPDLLGRGVPLHCGFRFRGGTTPLPPYSRGHVLRLHNAAAIDEEVPGSPLRLDPALQAALSRLWRPSGARPAQPRLGGIEGTSVRGWGSGKAPLRLRIDDDGVLQLDPPSPAGRDPWPFRLLLPPHCCDGRVHHLRLETDEGRRLDERVELLPFHLTPWPALEAHARSPLPHHLAPLARERHRSLLTWLRWADADGLALPPDLPLLQRLLNEPLQREGDLPAPIAPLRLPLAETPQVSVVIPVHNHYAVTRRCLAALAYAPTRVPFEVIVVDDGSTDGTAEALAREAPGVKVIRHDYARGFNPACHAGVAASAAELVVLLNNDTEPCAAWLEELCEVFRRWPDTGLAGGQLIDTEGRLQEAGCIVWGNGEPWNYGRGGNPHDPRHAYARQVDYVSGALLAIRRTVWAEVGGFSAEFSPAYYEDTDLAFKVRQAGYTVRYVPHARVVHHEGVSHGTQSQNEAGLKRFQEIHGPLFRRKWKAAFEGPVEPTYAAAERIKDRGIVGRALFVDAETPRPDRDAGSHAALMEMDLLQELGWKISFVPLNLAWLGAYSEEVQRRGIEFIHAPFVLSLEQLLQERGHEFDLVYLTRYTVAAEALPLLQRHAPKARLLFCNADLHHLRQLRTALAEDLEGEAAEAALAGVQQVRDQELAVMRQVHLTFSYSEVERAVIEAQTLGAAATAACPWVVEGPAEPAPLEGRSGVAFLGSYNHPPNRDAVESFLATVWPELHRLRPGLVLHLYGSGLDRELAERWGSVAAVVAAGWIDDTADAYDRHRIFIAPLRAGAGIKGKVAAAAAHGIPQVLSPVAAEATGLRDGEEMLLARGPAEWIEAIARLDADDDLWHSLSEASFRYAGRTWSRARGLALMEEALQRLHLPCRAPR